MKSKQELLKEEKILTSKLKQVQKQIGLQEVKRMQSLAGILKEEVGKEYYVDFGEDPKDDLGKLLRVIVDETNSFEGDEHDITGFHENTDDPDNPTDDFYGTLESNLRTFKQLPQNFRIRTNINGNDEIFNISKTGDESWNAE